VGQEGKQLNPNCHILLMQMLASAEGKTSNTQYTQRVAQKANSPIIYFIATSFTKVKGETAKGSHGPV
jgi:hypothetical protein